MKTNKLKFCFIFIVLISVNISILYAGERLQFEKQKVSFEKLSDGWKILPTKGSELFYAKRGKPVAKVWVVALKLKGDKTITPEQSSLLYLKKMEKKFPWKNLKITETGWTEIDGEKAYWLVSQHEWKGKTPIKQKLYKVHIDGTGYLFKYLAKEEDHEKTIAEFDEWIKTVEFSE
jgi:hypothetical protein